MRDDRPRLLEILEPARLLAEFGAGKSRSDVSQDSLLQSGFLQQLFIIGEAASRLSSDLKDRYPAIPWHAISGFRNHIAHEYFSLDLDIVWQTVAVAVPKLAAQVKEIVKKEKFGGPVPPQDPQI